MISREFHVFVERKIVEAQHAAPQTVLLKIPTYIY